MTAYRFVTLTCDECGEIYDPGQERSVAQVRRWARDERWVTRRRDGRLEDLCFRHQGWERVLGVGFVTRESIGLGPWSRSLEVADDMARVP